MVDSVISIRALREEGDACRVAGIVVNAVISIHALREESDIAATQLRQELVIISIRVL